MWLNNSETDGILEIIVYILYRIYCWLCNYMLPKDFAALELCTASGSQILCWPVICEIRPAKWQVDWHDPHLHPVTFSLSYMGLCLTHEFLTTLGESHRQGTWITYMLCGEGISRLDRRISWYLRILLVTDILCRKPMYFQHIGPLMQ